MQRKPSEPKTKSSIDKSDIENTFTVVMESLGSITTEGLMTSLTPGGQTVSMDRLGDETPGQFSAMAEFIIDENRRMKTLAAIVLRPL